MQISKSKKFFRVALALALVVAMMPAVMLAGTAKAVTPQPPIAPSNSVIKVINVTAEKPIPTVGETSPDPSTSIFTFLNWTDAGGTRLTDPVGTSPSLCSIEGGLPIEDISAITVLNSAVPYELGFSYAFTTSYSCQGSDMFADDCEVYVNGVPVTVTYDSTYAPSTPGYFAYVNRNSECVDITYCSPNTVEPAPIEDDTAEATSPKTADNALPFAVLAGVASLSLVGLYFSRRQLQK